MLGAAILLSAASLFFRDVKYLVEVVLTFAVFFVPVFYESRMMGKWEPMVLLNPISPILEAISATVIRHSGPNLGWLRIQSWFRRGISRDLRGCVPEGRTLLRRKRMSCSV